MRRLTISVDDALADTFDRMVQDHGYKNRSEAFRDLVRGELVKDRLTAGDAKYCVGVLSYVYNHHERELAKRLMSMQHDHHDVTIATMHAHLDHDHCIESVILQGPTGSVLKFAQQVIAEKGVRHGSFNPVPAAAEGMAKGRGHHGHVHPFT
jgi:CopG family nickel-responsive transcriptional regulator